MKRLVFPLVIFILVLAFLAHQRSTTSLVYAHLGDFYQKNGELDRSETFYRKSVQNVSDPALASKIYVSLAALAFHKGDHAQQLIYSKKAIDFNPRNPAAHGYLSDAYSMLGHHREALEHAKVAVRFAPGSDMYWNNLGLVYVHMGETENAVQSFNKALDINPKNTKAQENKLAALSMLK